jgi:5-hydroxyisourate hydrolase
MARISTHVLDIERGLPATGIPVDLYFERRLLQSMATDADGRTILLSVGRLDPGRYELIFRTADYLKQRNPAPFFEEISIRFGVADSSGNYHIPLLLAAHGYSTYRGS